MLKRPKTNISIIVLATGIVVSLMAPITPSYARDEATPHWPCIQRKVENLTVGQVWDGPSIDGLKGWWSDKPTMQLIDLLAARRTSKEEAEKAIKTFAAAQSEDKRDGALTLVFAGLFDKVNSTRRGIINGIERYFKAQEKRALKIEEMGTALTKLEPGENATKEDKEKYNKAKTDFDWASRIFQERQSNMPLACEVPVMIDQHLFQIAQLIRQNMEN